MAYRYQLQYRPLDFGTAPKGYLVDSARGMAREEWSRHNFGSIAYAEPLTADQVADFELLYVGEDAAAAELADERETAQWYTCNSSMAEITAVFSALSEQTRRACRSAGLLVGWMRLPLEVKIALRGELQRIHNSYLKQEEERCKTMS
jgi:hypothetical protein